jgi:hypothetical protein
MQTNSATCSSYPTLVGWKYAKKSFHATTMDAGIAAADTNFWYTTVNTLWI